MQIEEFIALILIIVFGIFIIILIVLAFLQPQPTPYVPITINKYPDFYHINPNLTRISKDQLGLKNYNYMGSGDLSIKDYSADEISRHNVSNLKECADICSAKSDCQVLRHDKNGKCILYSSFTANETGVLDNQRNATVNYFSKTAYIPGIKDKKLIYHDPKALKTNAALNSKLKGNPDFSVIDYESTDRLVKPIYGSVSNIH